MTKLILIPLAALAACSSPETTNETAMASVDGVDPASNTASAAKGEPPQAARDSQATPAPAEQKTFRDWAVACDNGKACEAVSLAPGESNLQDVGLIVRREVDGAVAVSIRATGEQSGVAELVADGQRVAGGTWNDEGRVAFDSAASDRLAAAIATARGISVRGASANTVTISLAGASAALRYMDAEQGRANTATALVAKGGEAFTGRMPALPVVVAVPLALGNATRPSAGLIAEMRRTSNCPADAGDGPVGDEVVKLTDRDTLVIVSCGSGAYNAFGTPFIVTDGKARRATTDDKYAIGEGDAGLQVVNASWDATTGRLSSYFKGRGLGDCGAARGWVWDGRQFRLVMAESEGNCRGAVKWLRTWTARVVRPG